MDSTNKNELQEPILAPKPISSELEDTLSNSNLTYFERLRAATCLELDTLFRLAAPAVVVYLLNNVISMSTQIFCGHLGNLQLAASSLGNTGIQVFAYGLMVNINIILYIFIYLNMFTSYYKYAGPKFSHFSSK